MVLGRCCPAPDVFDSGEENKDHFDEPPLKAINPSQEGCDENGDKATGDAGAMSQYAD